MNIDLFAELGNHWGVEGAKSNLANWFLQNLEKIKFVAAHNEYDKARTSRHQPGGTVIAVRGAMAQYAKATSNDSRGSGRFCSYAF